MFTARYGLSTYTVCPTRYRTWLAGWLAGGPLLRVATIRRTTDTHYRHIPFRFSHNERTPVQISFAISSLVLELLKKCRSSVASGTHCIKQKSYVIERLNSIIMYVVVLCLCLFLNFLDVNIIINKSLVDRTWWVSR